MKPITTPTTIGPSGQHNRFIVAAEYKADGLFSGVRVTVMQHGDKRDLTKNNVAAGLGALRAILVRDNEAILKKLTSAPFAIQSRKNDLATDDVVLSFEGDDTHKLGVEQARLSKNIQTIEIIHEYIHLLHEDTNLQFNFPSTQSKTMCVIS